MIVNSDSSGLGVDPIQITTPVGSTLLSIAGPIAIANPIAGAAVAVAGILTQVFGGLFGKPDYTKIAATRIVDAIESQVMKPNLAGWLALPSSQKTTANQQAFIDNFNLGWQKVIQGCSDAQLADAGVNCINDRQRGGKWDWFRMYLDPILNDPDVYDPTSTSINNTITSVESSFKSVNPLFLLAGGLVVGAIVFLSGDKKL